MLERNVLGNLNHQITADNNGFTMPGAFASVGNPVADAQIGHVLMLVDYDTRARVTENGVFAKFGFDFQESADGALQLDRVPNLAQMGGVLGHGSDNSFLVHTGRLGATANQRVDRAHQDVMA